MPNYIDYINNRSLLNEKTGCIEWQLCKDKNGYGKAKVKGKDYSAHRLSWIASNGDIPIGMHVLHKCDNPCCVNKDHLYIGTPLDNMKDKMSRGRYKGGQMYWKKSIDYGDGKRSTRGSLHHKAKLEEMDVFHIRHELNKGATRKALSLLYCVSVQTIHGIKNGLSWTHVKMECTS